MIRSTQLLNAAVLTLALMMLSSGANAQTAQQPPKRQAATGHQIVVHPRPSFLTAGTGASVGSHNGYALDTFNQPSPTEGTFTGMRGRERLENRFDGPGVPLFRF